MTPAVRQLVAEFVRELRVTAVDQVLEQLRAAILAAPPRNDNAPRAHRARERHKRRRRRRAAPRAPRSFPINPDGQRSVRISLPPDSGAGLVPKPAQAVERRPVVVRIDGRPSRIALLVGAPAPGFYSVRLSRGGNLGGWRSAGDRAYSPKVRRIVEGELVRDASARELELGYVVPEVTS